MELRHTAMRSARKVEIGTVRIQSNTVFFMHCRNLGYWITLLKFPIPKEKVAPLTALRPE